MSIETVIRKTGRKIAHAGLASILGLCAIGASAVSTNAQYKERNVSNVKIEYIPCTQQANGSEDGFSIGEIFSVLGTLGQLSNNPKDQKLGAIYSTLGAIKSEKEIAREGRSTVTVNNGEKDEQPNRILYLPAPGCSWINPESQNDLSVKQIWRIAVAANYFKDINNDGSASRNEIIGAKNTFYDDEPISFILSHPARKKISKKDINFDLYHLPNFERVDGFSWKKGDHGYVYFGGPAGWVNSLSNKHGYGKYLGVFSSGEDSEKVLVDILPSSERPKNQ